GAALGEELHEVLEVLHVAALVGGDGDALDVLLDRGLHDLRNRTVVAEVDDLAPLALEDPPHDVDRRVVTVEEARGGDEANGVLRHVQGAVGRGWRIVRGCRLRGWWGVLLITG